MLLTSAQPVRCSERQNHVRNHLRVVTLAAALMAGSVIEAQDNAADAARLVEVLRVAPGQMLADIGAGPEALLTMPMAKAVGPAGKVYATDLGEQLGRLRQTIAKAGVTNVDVIEGQPAATNLPAECCHAIYIRNVYHHFADPPAMNASLWRSVKAGGRIAVIDFRPRGSEAALPADRDEGDQHGVNPETVSRELVQAGFMLISSEDRPDRWFIVVVEKR
jgi:ubiquinone/menaquinone biosynthesis C-methylase UbiE